jgi:hypothetical protein
MAPKTPIQLMLAALIATGCESATSPPINVDQVRTDSLTYHLERVAGGYGAVAMVTYTNSGPDPVFFARCGPSSTSPTYSVVRSKNPTLWSVVGHVWGCPGGVPTGRLDPGETLNIEVWLGSADSPRANPPVLMEHRVGTFRIHLDLCGAHEAESTDCTLLSEDALASNEFEILPPPG